MTLQQIHSICSFYIETQCFLIHIVNLHFLCYFTVFMFDVYIYIIFVQLSYKFVHLNFQGFTEQFNSCLFAQRTWKMHKTFYSINFDDAMKATLHEQQQQQLREKSWIVNRKGRSLNVSIEYRIQRITWILYVDIVLCVLRFSLFLTLVNFHTISTIAYFLCCLGMRVIDPIHIRIPFHIWMNSISQGKL